MRFLLVIVVLSAVVPSEAFISYVYNAAKDAAGHVYGTVANTTEYMYNTSTDLVDGAVGAYNWIIDTAQEASEAIKDVYNKTQMVGDELSNVGDAAGNLTDSLGDLGASLADLNVFDNSSEELKYEQEHETTG